MRVSVVVARDRAATFESFVGGLGRWWPVPTHSLAPERVVDVWMERRPGGAVVEVWDDGSEHRWVTVLEYVPPEGFALRWQVHHSGGQTLVRVSFHAHDNGTRVEVEHTGWEHLGEAAASARESYATGWPVVLAAFRDASDAWASATPPNLRDGSS